MAAWRVQVATAVLIVACPCALTLAAPITLGTAMGMMGRSGLYLRNPGVALAMGRVDAVAFDKTGTLTSAGAGARLEAQGLTDADWRLVRRLAAESIHPVSRAIAATGQPSGQVTGCREVPGQGLRGTVDGHDVLLGSASFLAMETGTIVSADERRTGVAVDGRLRGWVHLVVPARAGVERAAGVLARSLETWLVSGDHPVEAPRWQPLFGARMRFRQSPEDKLQLVRDRQAAGRHVLMVGDGLNDAGALAAAEVGVAVSDDTACVVPACDAVVRGDRLEHLPQYLRFARHARRVIVICLAVSVAYNAIGIGLALAGLLTPLLTAILMPMSSLSIVGLSTAAMRWSARGALPAWV